MQRYKKSRFIFLLMFLIMGLGDHHPASAQEPKTPREKVFVGYLYGSPRNLNYSLYTHVCHSFITANDSGHLNPNRNVPDPAFIKSAHKAGVKVLVSLGGWGWDKQFTSIVSKKESEDRYLEAVMRLVDANDYDGIDLDWEYPDTKEEIVGFERLARRMRTALDDVARNKKRPMALTMAAAANPGTLQWLRKDFLLETMDWVNVMTYDMSGDWSDRAGHHSPFLASSKLTGKPRSSVQVIEYLIKDRGIPADRLALGIPLYGRGFNVAEPYASTKGVAKTGLPQANFNNLHRLQTEKGWTRIWDQETKNPWLLSPDHKMVIGYDDEESVAIKTEWAMKTGLRGVFFWQLAADRLPDGTNPLQSASRAKWAASVGKSK